MFDLENAAAIEMFKSLDPSEQAMVLVLSQYAVEHEDFNPYAMMNKFFAVKKMLELDESERLN